MSAFHLEFWFPITSFILSLFQSLIFLSVYSAQNKIKWDLFESRMKRWRFLFCLDVWLSSVDSRNRESVKKKKKIKFNNLKCVSKILFLTVEVAKIKQKIGWLHVYRQTGKNNLFLLRQTANRISDSNFDDKYRPSPPL